mgnify:CR=1 FL=1
MRRKDREITDYHEILKIMESCDVCRLSLWDEEFPYIVPLNFGIDVCDQQVYLYFHCANVGKKLDLIRKNNKATFEMDCDHNIILYKERMSCTMGYASVIGHGIIEFVEDKNKLDALKIIMRHYHHEDFKFNTDMMKVTTIFRLKVWDMTGKRRNNVHPQEKTKIHVSF